MASLGYSRSMYGGAYYNNVKWQKVRDVFGKVHWGKSREQLAKQAPHIVAHVFDYEFVRGEMIPDHILKKID